MLKSHTEESYSSSASFFLSRRLLRLIMERNDPRTECPGIQELQSIDIHLFEDAWPFSKGKRKHENAELIDQPGLKHRMCQFSYAILQQTLARLFLELPDLLNNAPLYEPGIPLKRLLQGSGCDILGHAVYPIRVFSLPGRPDPGEELVGLLTH